MVRIERKNHIPCSYVKRVQIKNVYCGFDGFAIIHEQKSIKNNSIVTFSFQLTNQFNSTFSFSLS